MRKLLLSLLAVSSALAATSSAEASGGCGRAFHRGPYGHCRPDRGPVFVGPPPAVGGFYRGRGYWDGRRYWQHREHWRGGWRYR